jgi:branched-chain amino acid transport system permease protein
VKLGAGLWGGLFVAIAAAALAGAIVGAFISHRRGIYYALLTIAFGQVFWFVSIKWHAVTGGEDGLPQHQAAGVPRLERGAALLRRRGARAGRARALAGGPFAVRPDSRGREAERDAAAFAGHATWVYKWSAFTASCAIAGIAGALFALAQQSAYPNVMSLHQSGFVVMMVLVGGGLVSFWGPVIGVTFFLLARDLLGAYTETWLLWFGLLFMAMVLFKPDGLVGLWRDLVAKRRR